MVGYKQTEVGLIPEDWEVFQISEISDSYSGGTPSTVNKNYYGGSINWITSSELNQGVIRCTSECITELGLKHSSAKLIRPSTLLVAMYGATAGVAAISKISGAINQAVLAINLDENKSIAEYLINYWRKNQAVIVSTYTQGGQPNLSGSIIKRIPVPLPELAEQRAIATALSDADAWIESLEKLIAKKRLVKQGAMQKLLTPGEDWEVRKLGEIADILDHLRKPLNDSERQKMKGDVPYCGANGVVDFVNDYLIDDNIILMAEDGGYFDEYKTRPIAYQMKGKCWVNNHAHILKAKSTIDQNFLYYSLVHKNILNYINGGTRAKLNKGELVNIFINIPLDNLPKQTRIASILSDMDAEIDALEKKLEKTRKVKLGMMQELLSGRVRLVKNETKLEKCSS